MKNTDREIVARFVDLPNIGKAIAVDLQLIGYKRNYQAQLGSTKNSKYGVCKRDCRYT